MNTFIQQGNIKLTNVTVRTFLMLYNIFDFHTYKYGNTFLLLKSLYNALKK